MHYCILYNYVPHLQTQRMTQYTTQSIRYHNRLHNLIDNYLDKNLYTNLHMLLHKFDSIHTYMKSSSYLNNCYHILQNK